ncbi:helix-turn-helix transcriptional regulator [Arenimonas malthae]|uniref:helix-turn-helix transcriptional regulator n=1 Tax=Arenimonas malthae TaxID=354197 RepID=UPI0005C2600E|nr:AlpA family transcriptional regulator [Arenimonas malthae]
MTKPTILIRLPEVVARTGLSKSSIWARARAGSFPTPVKLGPRTTAWVASEVDQWVAEALAARQHRPS